MLPGFLSTALEIIIILDVCGAIAYFTITGLTRIKDKKQDASPVLPNTSVGLPALAAEGPAMIQVPERVTSQVYDPVAIDTPPQAQPKTQWTAGFRQRITSLTSKFTYKPAPSGKAVQKESVDSDYAKLGRVLDSFKEDT